MARRFKDIQVQWLLHSRLSAVVIVIGVLAIIYALLNVIVIHKYATFRSPQYGIQFKFPANWRFTVAKARGSILTVLPPRENELDTFAENVTLTYWDILDATESFGRFSSKAVDQVAMLFSGHIKILESHRFFMHGREWYIFTFVGTGGKPTDDPLQFQYEWTVIGQRAFIFTYLARKSTFNKYFPEVKKIVGSFGPLVREKEPPPRS
jgi:hypothetical protein